MLTGWMLLDLLQITVLFGIGVWKKELPFIVWGTLVIAGFVRCATQEQIDKLGKRIALLEQEAINVAED